MVGLRGLDTSYAGYPFISQFLDCKLLVNNHIILLG